MALEDWNRWNPGASMTDEAFQGALNTIGITA